MQRGLSAAQHELAGTGINSAKYHELAGTGTNSAKYHLYVGTLVKFLNIGVKICKY